MREVNLDGIDEKYEKVKAFIETLGQINRDFNIEQGIIEDYSGPFRQLHELESLVKEVRKNLIYFVVRHLNTELCPNVTISESDIEKELTEKFGELEFNSNFIYRYIQANFATRSATLSREEILKKARYLLPTLWAEHGRREPKLEDIQQGRKLILHLYMESFYSDKFKHLAAIEKLIKITLDGADPAMVTDSKLVAAYWKDEPYISHEIPDLNIEKTRAHKNGKFLIYFKDENKARKVAKVLLRERKR